MAEANVSLDEIMVNPLFRKALHIIGTVTFGYIFLRLILFIFDTIHLGTAWLETNQDTGFLIIILILVSLTLLMDHAISYVRRNYGEEKHSIIDTGVAVAISNIQKYESKSPEIVKHKSKVSDIIASELSGLSKKYHKEEPTTPEVAEEAVKQKPIGTSTPIKGPVSIKIPASIKAPMNVETPTNLKEPAAVDTKRIEKEPPDVKKEDGGREFSKELIEKHIAKTETSEMPKLLEEIINKIKPDDYYASNVIFSNTVPIIVGEGKRMVKSFEANHSITVVDFKSKVTQKNVKLTVESLNAPSRDAKSVKNGLVYEYNNININLDNEYIEKAVVRFKVMRDWIIKNNISTIQMQQYIHDDWAILPTREIGQDAKYQFYEAYVSSFSLPFVIVGMRTGY
jgi:PGF-pre-PGF domain-containing protein